MKIRIPVGMPMRIAIATAKLDPRHDRAESWTIGLAKWLLNRDYEVHLVTLKNSDRHCVKSSGIHLLEDTGDRMQVASALSSWLKEKRFDIVHDMGLGFDFDVFQPHCGSLTALERGKWASLSGIQRLGRAVARPFANRKRSISKLASIQFAHTSALYIAVSGMVEEDLHCIETIPKNRIRKISNGVDTKRFNPVDCALLRERSRAKFGISDDSLAISVIAHNHQLKGIPQLFATLRGVRHLPMDIHVIVGGGHRQPFQSFAVGKHTVTFTGAVENPLEIYAATDVYLHPTHYDACCLSVLEAMACGIATITTRKNGASERIVHGQNGLLIDSPRSLDQAFRLIESFSDPVDRFMLGQAARETAETWTIEDNYRAVESLYHDLLSQRKADGGSTHRLNTRSAA